LKKVVGFEKNVQRVRCKVMKANRRNVKRPGRVKKRIWCPMWQGMSTEKKLQKRGEGRGQPVGNLPQNNTNNKQWGTVDMRYK